MTKLLVLESSLFPEHMSASRRITSAFVDGWLRKEPSATIVRRDLSAEPLPHADFALAGAWVTPVDKRSSEQTKAAAPADNMIEELLAADVIVIGAPMYNFSVPSTLKSWIDHVAIAGRTFRYTPEGRPEGLVKGKRVFVIASRGGIYSEGPAKPFNHQDPYLRTVLGFLGMTDVTVIEVEQQKMGPDAQAGGIAAATRRVNQALGAAFA